MTEPIVLEDFKVSIDPAEVRRFLGSKDRKRPAPGERFDDVLNDSLTAARGLIAPKAIYAHAAGREPAGSSIFAHLERMAFCVATIGPALEAEVTRLAAGGDLLRAVVLDSIGSVAAEAAAEVADETIAAEAAREGLKVSCRASPGYGDWDVREQEAVFKLLPAGRIGVRLSETFMMIPRKSVSFAVHVAAEPARLRSENSCENCARTNCAYRLE
ncbi:MAG: vitamin B12 dependent-methionine synthase activation domain-containing protein [Candidatus Krumholzibacteria bacterium]|nr:vitamin B12 dependent-methionine synthase activation domain-containing protein [Candidatus Krumholzibacteria bacterium]